MCNTPTIAQQATAKIQPITANNVKRCGLDDHFEKQMKNNPNFVNQFLKDRNQHSSKVNLKKIDCTTGNSIVIPVAVHFGDPFTTDNPDCLKQATQLQVAALNRAFGAVEADNEYYGLNAACAADYPLSTLGEGGACIQFCLATQNHPTASGLADGEPAITVGQHVWTGSGNTDAAPWAGYLNIFVSSPATAGLPAGVLGISALPGNADGDGFWVHPFAFGGEIACASGPIVDPANINENTDAVLGIFLAFNEGETAVHEAGHYFGLLHVFETAAGACNPGDFISDTYPQQVQTSGCPSVNTCAEVPINTCDGGPTNFWNFMDYSDDDCLSGFSEEQTSVMNQTALGLAWNSEATTCSTPTCDFAITYLGEVIEDGGSVSACPGFSFLINDLTDGCPTDWNWTATGGNGLIVALDDADPLNPTVTVNNNAALAGGTLTITLDAFNGGSCTLTKTINVDVLDPSDAACQCGLIVVPDYANAQCSDLDNDGVVDGLFVPLTVINNTGSVVWIEQSDPPNTVFDTGVDLDILATNITFPLANATFTVYDDGDPDCELSVTVEGGNYSCDGVTPGDPPLRNCSFTLAADEANFTCIDASSASIILTADDVAGNLTFTSSPTGAATVSGTGTPADPYVATINFTADPTCPVTITATDDGADISTSEIVEIISPASIAGGINNVGTNSFPDWGIDINTVSPCVSGILVPPTDGTAPDTDFCEPAPPATPTAAQCNGISGNIAVIDRGSCNFTSKAENAQACGAVAVVICNNDAANPDAIINMSGASVNPVTIPTISLSYNQCQEIYAEMANGDVEVCIGAASVLPTCERSVTIDPCASFTCGCTADADCDDGDACTIDTCDGNGDCQYAPLDCDDGDVCNGDETCDAINGCQAGTPLNCDDGDACNGDETCDPINGCQAGTPLDCDDGIACTVDSCDPVNGCINTPDDSSCDNGDVCDGIETCDPVNGCITSPGLNCDDGNPCNGIETCDPVNGCQAGTAPTCGDGVCDVSCGETFANCADCSCTDDSECNDGNVCNGEEICDPVDGCQAGTPLDCDDGDACNGEEICDPVDGCQAGTPLTCDDGDDCTTDSCDPVNGCVYTPIPDCSNCPENTDASIDVADICAGENVTLTGTSDDVNVIEWTWSVSVNGSTPTVIATGLGSSFATRIYTTDANTSCDADVYEFTLVAICTETGEELFNGSVGTVNVYPTFAEGDNYTLQLGTCTDPATVVTNCGNFSVVGSYLPPNGESGSIDVTITNTAAPANATCTSTTVSVPYACLDVIPGCTDALADNFDPNANSDDGSCVYSGCTDATAPNYNPNATTDDGSCLTPNDPSCTIDFIATEITQGSQGGVTPFYYNIYNIEITNGTPPYDYFWNTNGFTRPGIIGVGIIKVIGSDRAAWSVTVTDANGCVVIINEDLNNVGTPTAPTLDITTFVIDCESSQFAYDGSINITMGGGTPPYTYQWSTGETTQDIIGLQDGWYSVVVTDATGDMTEGWYWVPQCSGGRGKVANTTSENNIRIAPNPFSEITTIEFTANQSGRAVVEIYNMAGAKINTLFNGQIEGNTTYKTVFNANNLPSGVYFTRFVAPTGEVSYEKLLLTK